MSVASKYLGFLGHKVRDRVTGFEGIVTSVGFDLYGCVQMVVQPDLKDGKGTKLEDAHWFDEKRLEKLSSQPVMDQPRFVEIPGPAQKPPMAAMPRR